MTLSALSVAARKSEYAVAPELVLTPDGVEEELVLVVREGRIVTLLHISEYDGDAVRLPGYAVIPGFIDTHTHVGQIFGKALTGGEPAQIWRRIWHPMEAAMGPDEAYASAKWMCLEALRGGFTTLVSYGLNDTEKNTGVHRAVEESGLRFVSSTGLDQFAGDIGTGSDVHELPEIVDRIERHVEQCRQHTRITPSVCCSSFHANSPETLSALSEYCAKQGLLLQIHANEHFAELQDCLLRFGKRPTQFLDAIGVLGPHVLLHHTTVIAEDEIEILTKTRTATSYNPLASIWKGNAVAPALSYAQRNVRFGIGSDNTSEDAFRNLFAAEASQRIAHAMPVADFSCGAAWTWVDAATCGAADAAGLGTGTGSLAPGMAADFLVLDMDVPECLPAIDFEWELVRYYNRDQIGAMVVDGKVVATGGQPLAWNTTDVINELGHTAEAVVQAPEIVRLHGPSVRYRPRRRG